MSTARGQQLSPGQGPCSGGSAEVKNNRHISIHQSGQASLSVNEVAMFVRSKIEGFLYAFCLKYQVGCGHPETQFLDMDRRPGTQVNSLLTQVEPTAERDHLSFSL